MKNRRKCKCVGGQDVMLVFKKDEFYDYVIYEEVDENGDVRDKYKVFFKLEKNQKEYFIVFIKKKFDERFIDLSLIRDKKLDFLLGG